MQGKIDSLERFLSIINKQEDLLNLYFRGLPFFTEICDVDKLLFFKFSQRKQCFDLKVGLKRDDIRRIVKQDYENYDIDALFRTDFNLKVRRFGSPCNNPVRAFIKTYIGDRIKIIKKDEIHPNRFKIVFEELGLSDDILFVPLVSLGTIVGFMLFSPVCNVSDGRAYFDAFSCFLHKLLLLKSVSNLENIIASQKEATEKDKRIYKLGKTTFIVAHEMKNSLIGIMGLFNRLVRFLPGDNERVVRYAELIKSQLNKLYNFTVDVNKFSKVNLPTKLEDVDIGEVLDNSIEMATTLSSDVSFSLSITVDDIYVFADKSQLEQVFLNLFKNSIEAKEHGKVKINISVTKEDDKVMIRIRDNSGGVDDNMIKDMLKPFFTTKSYGTGLGLSVVKSIIDNYKGELKFKNVPGGLECVIKLPISREEESNVS